MSTKKEMESIRDSANGVDAVLNRMYDVLGVAGVSMATALDVPPQTIKTWKRRGAVPFRFLDAFARQHNVSIDMLQKGAERYPVAADEHGKGNSVWDERAQYVHEQSAVLTTAELALVRNYRRSGNDGMGALEMTAIALANRPDSKDVQARRDQERDEMAKGTEADKAWPMVAELVYGVLLSKETAQEMPSARRFRELVTAVLVALRVEEDGEIQRDKAKRKITSML